MTWHNSTKTDSPVSNQRICSVKSRSDAASQQPCAGTTTVHNIKPHNISLLQWIWTGTMRSLMSSLDNTKRSHWIMLSLIGWRLLLLTSEDPSSQLNAVLWCSCSVESNHVDIMCSRFASATADATEKALSFFCSVMNHNVRLSPSVLLLNQTPENFFPITHVNKVPLLQVHFGNAHSTPSLKWSTEEHCCLLFIMFVGCARR